MLIANRSRRLARVLVASGLNLSNLDKWGIAMRLLVRGGYIELNNESWDSIAREVLLDAARLETLAYGRLFAMLGVSNLRGLARVPIAKIHDLRPGSKCVASVQRRYLRTRIEKDRDRKFEAESKKQRKSYTDEQIRTGKVREIYFASDATATKRLHSHLRSMGPDGEIATLVLIA